MLPVLQLEPRIATHLAQHNRLVLTAPTGSGKTTQIPQILLRHDLAPGQILVLQPRRLAARLVALRVAQELDSPIGELVGYQTRHDSQVGRETRIRFLTEGLFLRLLQTDPHLREVGAVVLDEFHERSLAADTALGLCRRLQETHRPDLRLLVMSATLDVQRVSAFLDSPALEAHGRAFPVDLHYQPFPRDMPVWEQAARALAEVLARETEGDVLVFMPGAYEIRRTIEAAQERLRRHPEPLSFFPLHGSLPARQQDQAVAPCAQRKIIVATNVAETSITIEGIRHVVDAGQARVHRHDPRRGIDALLVEPVSRASTEQRAGRAGRTAPGTCTRLWSRQEQEARPAHEAPEIRRLDLADALLQLRYLGVEDLRSFPWLEPPEEDAIERAEALLSDLGALDGNGALTETGKRMALLPVHPRLSRFLVEAAKRGCLSRACLWAALVSERDVLLSAPRAEPRGEWPSDLEVRESLWQQAKERHFEPDACSRLGLNPHAARDIERSARLYGQAARRAGLQTGGRGRTEDLLKCLLTAFSDRVALRRSPDSLLCAMAGQRRVELDRDSAARHAEALIALEVRELEARREQSVRTVLSLASAIDPSWLAEVHPGRVHTRRQVLWNTEAKAVEEVETRQYGDLVLESRTLPKPDPLAAEALLVEKIQSGEIALEKWDREVEQWILRTRLLARLFPERGLVCYDEEEISVILHEIVAGGTRHSHVRARPCLHHAKNALPWKEQQFVESMAPEHLRLPSGVRMKIEYGADGPPRGRAKIQELYDLQQTPAIAGGRQKLLLEILGPNFRPVQVTDDLESFWGITYPEVKKELKRRYPKHEWR